LRGHFEVEEREGEGGREGREGENTPSHNGYGLVTYEGSRVTLWFSNTGVNGPTMRGWHV